MHFSTDIRHVRCDSDLTATWPNEVEDSDLFWASNEDENLSGPKFRLFTEVDVRTVEPNTQYKSKYLFAVFYDCRYIDGCRDKNS